ncbi:hypothetical protein ABRZ04_04575 [Castellaniella ginsengisoli]|uniref:DUF2793 domain-containing protein n=1 Tax=Castellaniella ginsengisoli TaxID=546114 RepID=A0AB39D2L1_9BURK
MTQEAVQITTTPPLPGLQLVQDLNKALQTLATDFSGETDPAAIAWAYSTWADTGTGTFKRRNAANSAWAIEGRLLRAHLPMYAQVDVPALDIGPIYIIGKGPAEWDGVAYAGNAATTDEAKALEDGRKYISPKTLGEVLAERPIAAIQGAYKNLTGSATGTNTHAAFVADQIIVENDSGDPKKLTALSLDIDSATVGANGLDTGTLAASTWYSAWVIWNGTTTAGLLSLSDTAPTLPSGYTHKARIGWIRTDGTANKHPLAFRQHGNKVRYTLTASGNSTATPKMSSGAKGAPNTPTYVTIGVTGHVPPTAHSIVVSISNASNNTELSIVATNPNQGAPASTTGPALGLTSYGYGNQEFSLMLESTNIYYATAASALYCVGWEDSL